MTSFPTINYFANLTLVDGVSLFRLDEVNAIYHKYNPTDTNEISPLVESVDEYLQLIDNGPCVPLRYMESKGLVHTFQKALRDLQKLRDQDLSHKERVVMINICINVKLFMAWNNFYKSVEASAFLYLEA